MTSQAEVLTIAEVAADLRCSKAHVYNLILRKVRGVTPLPIIPIGRRKLVLRSTLEDWKRTNQRIVTDGMLLTSPQVDAVDA
jgi:hypothetical protein